jgi:hypothetical protein
VTALTGDISDRDPEFEYQRQYQRSGQSHIRLD